MFSGAENSWFGFMLEYDSDYLHRLSLHDLLHVSLAGHLNLPPTDMEAKKSRQNTTIIPIKRAFLVLVFLTSGCLTLPHLLVFVSIHLNLWPFPPTWFHWQLRTSKFRLRITSSFWQSTTKESWCLAAALLGWMEDQVPKLCGCCCRASSVLI